MSNRLAVVIYNCNSHDMVELAAKYATSNRNPNITRVYVIDNGSTPPYPAEEWKAKGIVYKVIRYEENVGPNYLIHRWMKDDWFKGDLPDYICFTHGDVFIREAGFDFRLIQAFENDPKLALVGFVGSNEIDGNGGRGGGTTLSFMGDNYPGFGQASRAEQHGKRLIGFQPAAVLDGCVLAFRTSMIPQLIPAEGNYPPHHFYDRMLSCDVLENGLHVGLLGIAFDHLSGGIRGGVPEYHRLCRKWLDERGMKYDPNELDRAIYLEAERIFLSKYRDDSGFFPLRVDPNHKVTHFHRKRGGYWSG